jgi:hypothetical protein
LKVIFEPDMAGVETAVILLEVMAIVAKITIDCGFLKPELEACSCVSA